MNWVKHLENPVIRPQAGTWKHDRCTGVTVAEKDGTVYLYHDGGIGSWWNGYPGFNWIGLVTCPADQFDGKTFTPFELNPILTHGRFCDFDRTGMISPRIQLIDGKFFLYYCGVSYESFTPGKQPRWKKAIGLAISEDGINFERVSREPVVATPPDVSSGCPKPYWRDGKWHMLCNQAFHNQTSRFGITLRTSDDPTFFGGEVTNVFGPGEDGAWDSNSIAAPAFCYDPDESWYYVLYGGSDRHWDYPSGIGLARSRDLRNWERHPHNPVIKRGEAGQWDDGAMWVTEFIKFRGRFYAWYEGRSAGRDRSEEYSPGATKQIGLMTNSGPLWPA